ncbi:DUF4442 domain-containing protein [Aeromonas jandaei]|nr:DUF4442 domain-containing protein [Aeromonas jandaei]MVG13177.1 DUF4442 domain-containing protein [Aeromonas jandaei]PPA30588.1 DUF4442 domain-containing protein [Aeromonas jandaei]PTT45858.1 DUF4442 domain-containing protein [Aeromonas sp. HMWF016]QNF18795.1 DUF4442 domain-containing protein [Aeromonas jandaei]
MRSMDWLFDNAAWVRRALNAWPPFWGAGIKIETLSDDFRYCRVTLKSRWWNKNANRTQFGGSMFAMTDPIYPLMLMGYFKNRYYVWDKAGSINYIKPGKGKLVAEFNLSDGKLAEIVAATEGGIKYFPEFEVTVQDGQGELVAQVKRTLYVRAKPEHRGE